MADFEGVPADVLELLRAAALLGDDFGGDELAAVTGYALPVLTTRVRAALAEGLLVEQDDLLRFPDSMVRQAVYGRIPESHRSALHAKAARALDAAAVPVERVARQLARASGLGYGWAADWLTENADELIFRAPELAAEVFLRALDHVEPDDPRRLLLETKFAVAATATGATELVDSVVGLLELPVDRDQLVRRTYLAGIALLRAGRDAEALEVLVHADAADELWQGRFASLRAEARWNAGEHDDARDLARRAWAEAGKSGDGATLYFAARVMALSNAADGETERALHWLDRGLEALDGQWRATDWRCALLIQRSKLLDLLDRDADALRVIEQAAELTRLGGSRRRRAEVASQAAALLYQAGRWDEVPDGSGSEDLRTLIQLHRAGTSEETQPAHAGPYIYIARARREEDQGRTSNAVRELLPILDCAADDRYFALPELTRLAMSVDEDIARATVAAAEEDAARAGASPRSRAVAGFCRGLLESDDRALARAAAYFERTGRSVLRAQALAGLAVSAAGQGRGKEAREYLGSALDAFHELRAAAEVERLSARLRASGVKFARRGAIQGWDSLTPAEARVAELVAEGLTNPEIALQLVVSARTIQTHVSRALCKLGVRSRSEIAWAVARRRTPAPEQPAWEDRTQVHADVPGTLRPVVHQRVAKALHESGADLRAVAQHLARGPEIVGGWSLDWLVENAEGLAVHAPDLGVALLRRAVDRVPNEHPAMTLLREKLAGAVYRIGSADEVSVLRSLRERAVDPERQAMASYMLAGSHLRHGDPGSALDTVDSALAAEADPGWAGRFRGLRARVLCYQGRYSEAEALADQAVRTADTITAYSGHHVHSRLRYMQGDVRGALETTDAALKVVASPNRVLSSDPVLQTYATQILLYDELDRRDEARETLARALEVGVSTHAQARLALVTASAAVLEFSSGHWDAAIAEVTAIEGFLPPERTPPTAWLPWQALGVAALIAMYRGQDDAADAFLARLPARPIPADAAVRARAGFALSARALRADHAGRTQDAMDLLVSALDPEYEALGQKQLWLPQLVRMALDQGRRDHAEAAVRAAQAEASGSPARAAAAQHCRGLVLGDPAMLAEVADYYEKSGRRLALGQAEEDLAALAAASGDLASARLHLAQAVETYAALDAQTAIQRADTRLRRLDVRRGRARAAVRPETGWSSLTPTETRVAELVARGMSNPEIALALAVSPRTIQTHVSHILAKLGVGSRSRIARAAAQHVTGQTPETPH